MLETQYRLTSLHLRNERSIWIHEPEELKPVVTVFLDAELYRERVGAVSVIDGLLARNDIESSLFVFVSMESVASRWVECECNVSFARFIDEELFPWIEEKYPVFCDARESVIVGLSYTGLAAVHAAMMAPHRFTKVIAQSGSFWWNDCWITRRFDQLEPKPKAQFYLDVGSLELAENVRHKEDVLQVVSQIEGVKRFCDVLHKYGYRPLYSEFLGGHDSASWRRALPDALRWALPTKRED